MKEVGEKSTLDSVFFEFSSRADANIPRPVQEEKSSKAKKWSSRASDSCKSKKKCYDLRWRLKIKVQFFEEINHKNLRQSEVRDEKIKKITRMDYSRVKLLLVLLAADLIVAENLNKLSYGELGWDFEPIFMWSLT